MNPKALLLSLLSLLVFSFCQGEIVELDDATFEHQTQASTGMTTGSWFVLFKAERCAHCKRVKPEFERLSQDEELQEKGIVFATVDVPSNRMTSARFMLKGFPVLYYFHKGKMYKYKGQRMHDPLKTFLMETVDTMPGDDIPEPVSGLTIFYREITGAGQDFYDAVSGQSGPVGVAIVGLVTVFFVLVTVMIGFFFWPSSKKSDAAGKKKK